MLVEKLQNNFKDLKFSGYKKDYVKIEKKNFPLVCFL